MNKISLLALLTISTVLVSPALAQMPLDNAPLAPATGESADPNAPKVPDVSARNEIIYRANLGRADDVKLLISQGGSANQTTGEGVPVLCLASGRKDEEGKNVVEALLKAGADINARDRKGQTALFYAARTGSIETLNFLLENKIDMYALDNNGDLARTVAFAAGRKDVVQAMDAFISRPIKPTPTPSPTPTPAPQSTAISSGAPIDTTPPDLAKERELEKKLEESKKNAPTAEEMKRISGENTEANRQRMIEEDHAPPADDTLKTFAHSQADSEREAQSKQEMLEKLSYDLSFNTCSFQYWSFCSLVHQKTELEPDELAVAITSTKAKVEAIKKKMLKDFDVKVEDYYAIVDSAQQRIYNQLNTMISAQERRENGVGRMDDMQARCKEIALQWSAEPPGVVRPDKSKKTSKQSSDNAGASGGSAVNANHINRPQGAYVDVPTSQNIQAGQSNNGSNKKDTVAPPLQEIPGQSSVFK